MIPFLLLLAKEKSGCRVRKACRTPEAHVDNSARTTMSLSAPSLFSLGQFANTNKSVG